MERDRPGTCRDEHVRAGTAAHVRHGGPRPARRPRASTAAHVRRLGGPVGGRRAAATAARGRGGGSSWAALAAANHNPASRAFGERPAWAGKKAKVISTAVAGKLVVPATAALKSRPWDPRLALPAEMVFSLDA
jgi:hypothetical protein